MQIQHMISRKLNKESSKQGVSVHLTLKTLIVLQNL